MALSNIGGEEPSTITFRVGTVTHARGSTTEHQEIVVLGGQESSAAIAAVLNTTPTSTAWALAVRGVERSVAQSTQADLRATIYQSTAADLNVTVAGYVAPSTTVTVSTARASVYQSTAAKLNVTVAGYVAPSTTVSVANAVLTRPNDTNWASSAGFHFDGAGSLAVGVNDTSGNHLELVKEADNWAAGNHGIVFYGQDGGAPAKYRQLLVDSAGHLQVDVTAMPAGSTTVTVSAMPANSSIVQVSSLAGAVQARVYTSSGGAIEGSTGTPGVGVLGLHVREALPVRASTSILVDMQTAGGSTTLLSSAAALKWRVYAFSVTSTVVGVSSCAFISSNKERWGLLLGTGSSGISGANLTCSMPTSLFETDVAEALGFSASSSGLYRVSIAYWQDT